MEISCTKREKMRDRNIAGTRNDPHNRKICMHKTKFLDFITVQLV
jgi:hypothetical protein